MAISYQYLKPRRSYGRQPMFSEVGPLMCDSIPVNPIEQRAYGLRNPVHQATQNAPNFSKEYINTIRAEYTSTGINHAEGGWPKDVNVLDIELTQRYRRKVEKDDPYIHCIMGTAPAMEHYILQNNAIDMYHTYYTTMRRVMPLERIGCRIVNMYRDPSVPNRPVSAICWQPEGGHQFAVAYNNVDFNRQPRNNSSFDCYLWNVENPNFPEVTLNSPCALVDIKFNPRDSSMIAAGMIDGRVGIWDARVGGEARATCAPHVAHRDLAKNVIFINAKSGQEFFSGSTDGSLKWWDARNMANFTDEVILDVVKASFEVQNMAVACGVGSLEFEPTIPTRFLVGTENGFVIGGNRKGKTPLEKLPFKFPAHVGPVVSLERNPGFLKNFLTVGTWTARVWSEDCRESAILWSPPHRHRLSAGAWSPTRLSLMMLAQYNGVLALWDLLRNQYEPVLSMHVCKKPLLSVCPHEQGSLILCGNSVGNIYILELSKSLSESEPHDKVLMTQMLERESRREHILETRLREIRLKLRQAEEGGVEVDDIDLAAEAAIGDKDLAEASQNYMVQVKRELAAI